MADLKDTQSQHAGLMSAVRDIMMKNQNLYQQDLEDKYGKYSEAPTPEVDVPEAEIDVPVEQPVEQPEQELEQPQAEMETPDEEVPTEDQRED
jgi:hypothetical protein